MIVSGLFIAPTVFADVKFEKHTLVNGEATYWWARSHADVNQDGLQDFFVINDCANGGWLGWYETQADYGASKLHIIAETDPDGNEFAAGDLDSGDIDGDGDVDVITQVSEGEWVASHKPSKVYWYSNPEWKPYYIGTFPSFVKDFDLVDLNGDGLLDLVGTSFDARRLVVFRQDTPENWIKVADIYVHNLHEGQHVGDLDGDGDIDVVSTAFWFDNPGGDMSAAWRVRNIDPYWNSDEGRDWGYNATKIVCADIDDDGRDEVFISCSEKFRNLIAWYDLDPEDKDNWTRHEIGINSYAHTLQVGDVDGDGDLDVLSGNNGGQQWSHNSPVILFLYKDSENAWERWSEQQILTLEGAYNSYLVDVEGDGDLDFFRYAGHGAKDYELWINQGYE